MKFHKNQLYIFLYKTQKPFNKSKYDKVSIAHLLCRTNNNLITLALDKTDLLQELTQLNSHKQQEWELGNGRFDRLHPSRALGW